jgi:ankyrin repeat protein
MPTLQSRRSRGYPHRRGILDVRNLLPALLCLLLIAIANPAIAKDPRAREESKRNIPAAEDPAMKRAELAVRTKDYKRAIEIWRNAATRGNARAAYRLGVAYRSGLAVPKDNRLAAKWFQTAAEGGDHAAQFSLGTFYQNGTVVSQNRDEAIRLFGLAARGGNRDAKARLARLRNSNGLAYGTADARVGVNRSDPREALAQAIRLGDVGSAKEALARGAPINGAPNDTRHWRPLILAIMEANAEIVGLLLAHKADPNLNSRLGEPALILAVRRKEPELVRALLRAGATPNRPAVSGYPPLMEAARLGTSGVARLLLGAGADPKFVLKDGTSAAAIARRFGHHALSQELSRRGSPIIPGTDPSARRSVLASRSPNGTTDGTSLPPVIEAARRGDVDLLKEMVGQNIDLSVADSEGGNAITRAAEGGHVNAVKFLLSVGVEPDLPGHEGMTALMAAMQSQSENSDQVFTLLLESGADPAARDDSGRGLIDFAASGATAHKLRLLQDGGGSWTSNDMRKTLSDATASGRRAVVEALLGFVQDPKERLGAICRAVEQTQPEILELLVSVGSSLEADCGAGRRPLVIAAHDGNDDLVRQLLHSGASPDGRAPNVDTALIAAAGRGHSSIIDRLLQGGADVDRRGARRMTALMAAATNGEASAVDRLLRAGADQGKRSDQKLTALDFARQSGNTEVVELIEADQSGWLDLFGASTK